MFLLTQRGKDVNREELLIAGIKTYYSFYLHQEIKVLNNNYRKLFKYLITSLSLASSVCFFKYHCWG